MFVARINQMKKKEILCKYLIDQKLLKGGGR